jgi:hypothetical protein
LIMPKLALSRVLALGTVLLALGAAPAWGQYFVKPDGNNGAACTSPATACATVKGALDKTVLPTVIHVFPGYYLATNITKSAHIIADEGAIIWGAGFQCPDAIGAAAICVNAAATDVVRISGFAIHQTDATHWAGIRFLQGAALHVENILLLGSDTKFALQFVPSAGASELYVSDSVISDNRIGTGAGGILIKPTGSGSANVVLDNVNVENNRVGVQVDGTGSTAGVNVTLVNSVVSGNSGNGVTAISSAGKAPVQVFIDNSTVGANIGVGVNANGAAASGAGSATVRLRASSIVLNATGVSATGAGVLLSYGNNAISGNLGGNGPVTLIGLQ